MQRPTTRPHRERPPHTARPPGPAEHGSPGQRLLPLGALAAGFGLLCLPVSAQQAPGAGALPATVAPATAAAGDSTMAPITVTARPETDANSVRATTTTIGRGVQDMRDIPQSLTVVTEKLLDDRRADTLKEALRQTAGITFQAAEGSEEDVRLRGFSLATSGDIYVDGVRDPAFYDRDAFNYDRVELLRGSASMLFGRGSTGGVVNQVQKQAVLGDAAEVAATVGSGRFRRFTGDVNRVLGRGAAVRVGVMKTDADQWGNAIDKSGLAANVRWGIASDDVFSLSGYVLRTENGINYGLPWLRQRSDQPASGSNPSSLIPGLDPKVYYNAASDVNEGSAEYATFSWAHRLGSGGEWKTTVRRGSYERDLRAGTIRFCVAPACPGFTQPGRDGPVTVTPATPLNRGSLNKVQDLHTTYLQSDLVKRFGWFGLSHDVITGIDLAHEEFRGYATVLPPGVVLDKNTPRTTIGTPDDGGGFVDEGRRLKRQQAGFDARSAGVFAQDLVQVADDWKLLVGLRYDKVRGSYRLLQSADSVDVPPGTLIADRARADGLWSKRVGVLWQPSDTVSTHLSWGTSFNTSGDAYQYDLPGSNTGPEASRNIELGAKLELFESRVSARAAVFHTTKYNERNRDSPTGLPLVDYLLSGKRHAAGVDLDIAGRIVPGWEVYGSYSWIPVAKIDAGNPLNGTTLSGERVGDRPSLTPRHSGTLWSTWQATDAWRVGAGINARGSQTPNRNPAGVVAPRWVTGDLLAEFRVDARTALRFNVLNVTDKYYADTLYTGHYVQGAPRTLSGTVTVPF